MARNLFLRNLWQLVSDFVFVEGDVRARVFPQSIAIFSETFLTKVLIQGLRKPMRQLIDKISCIIS